MFHVLSFQEKLCRVLRNSVFFLSFIFSASLEVKAQNVLNFGQWRNFNSVSKQLYIAGTLDGIMYSHKRSEDTDLLPSQIRSCISDLNIKISETVAMVDNFYLNSKNWGFTPQDAIQFQLIDGHCYQYTASKN